jgi:G3E family GTPase
MESVKQVAVADRIVLTKADLLDTPQRRLGRMRCSRACARSSRGAILDAAAGEATPERLLALRTV